MQHKELIAAMIVLYGFYYDAINSYETPDATWLVFNNQCGAAIHFDSWINVKNWIENVVPE